MLDARLFLATSKNNSFRNGRAEPQKSTPVSCVPYKRHPLLIFGPQVVRSRMKPFLRCVLPFAPEKASNKKLSKLEAFELQTLQTLHRRS